MLSQKLGYDTYDYLPPDKVKYPFVVISGVEDNKNNTKTELTGSIVLTIDCWGTPKQRLTINEMVERFFMPQSDTSAQKVTRITGELNSNQPAF